MFFKCKTQDDCKSLFRKLAKILHPDTGGNTEMMILLQEAYEDKLSKFSTRKEQKKPEKESKKTNDYKIVDGDKRCDIFGEIYQFYSDNPEKNSTFFDSVFAYFLENDYFTVNQYQALVNIYTRYKIGKTDWP